MMAMLRLAELELLRFLRGRSGALIAGAATFVLLGVLLCFPFSLYSPGAGNSAPWDAEVRSNELRLLEAPWIVVMALSLAAGPFAADLKGGAFVLLEQATLSHARLLAGRMLGIATNLLIVHALLSIPAFAFDGCVRRSATTLALQFFGAYALALCFVPLGLAMGHSAALAARKQRVVLSSSLLGLLLQTVIPVLLLAGLVRSELLPPDMSRWEAIVQFVPHALGDTVRTTGDYYGHAAMPLLIGGGCQAAGAALTLRGLLVRLSRRASA